jgi:hypothetical protein
VEKEKTLMLFELFGEGDTSFYEFEGDLRRFDGVFINFG